MADPSPYKLTGSRIFIIVFFGLALLLAITTIVGSLRTWNERDGRPTATQPVPQ